MNVEKQVKLPKYNTDKKSPVYGITARTPDSATSNPSTSLKYDGSSDSNKKLTNPYTKLQNNNVNDA